MLKGKALDVLIIMGVSLKNVDILRIVRGLINEQPVCIGIKYSPVLPEAIKGHAVHCRYGRSAIKGFWEYFQCFSTSVLL